MDKGNMLELINKLKAEAFKEAEAAADEKEPFEETVARAEKLLKDKLIGRGIRVGDVSDHLLMMTSDVEYLTGSKLH